MAVPSNSLFQQLNADAEKAGIIKNTKASQIWFQSQLGKMRQAIAEKAMLTDRSMRSGNKAKIGKMYAFRYDPKGKLTLPFYDAFPLILMVGPAPGGFYGINLHYLPPRARAVFFDKLMSFTNRRFDDNTQVRMSYNMLRNTSRLKEFKPCFKHYLLSHIKGFAVEVPAQEWGIALFMPCENWK